jgi:rare lipoprotein A
MPPQRCTSRTWLLATFATALLAACAPPPPAEVERPLAPQLPRPEPRIAAPAPAPEPSLPPATAPGPSIGEAGAFEQRGRISLYGKDFAGKQTASGDIFDPQDLTMAHPTLPFGTRVRVTNLQNHKSVEVVVNDRGPNVPGRIADLSAAAARRIGMTADGVVEALLEVLKPSQRR